MIRIGSAIGAVVIGLGGLAATGCGSTLSPAAAKVAFCKANVTIDQAGANTTSIAAIVPVLKAHQAQLNTLNSDAPAGKVGSEAKALVTAARAAIASNNGNLLTTASISQDGADVDTYCGVDGNGDPLPSYFANGTGSAFCASWDPLYSGVGNASDPAAALSFLEGHQSLINAVASESSSLPSDLMADVTTLVAKARAAIAANNPSGLGQGNGTGMDLALYCGQNS